MMAKMILGNTDDDVQHDSGDNTDNRCAQCSELQKRCEKYKFENKRMSSKAINDEFIAEDDKR